MAADRRTAHGTPGMPCNTPPGSPGLRLAGFRADIGAFSMRLSLAPASAILRDIGGSLTCGYVAALI